ncbi:MAG: hypothetical protein HYT31_00790 [Parcubacteria group bacterium]|nr:hypothetical protein [Parcubacteria group bacterium]
MDIAVAKKIMGRNFIGPDELNAISSQLSIARVLKSPKIPFSAQTLKKYRASAVLILGVPKFKSGKNVTINNMRNRFGMNPKKQPCFYNQDWYLKERFASQALGAQWHLVSASIKSATRGKEPSRIKGRKLFPSAILAAFTFFAYYLHTKGGTLWKHDFIWCSDTDGNGDQIYVGRYCDWKAKSKKGFNIHRHLRIRANYGAAPEIV